MKIGLLGYGKMGKAIESIALARGFDVCWRIGSANRSELNTELLRQADVVIEFTRPEAAFENVMQCLEAGVPVVCGTTGWLDKYEQAADYCRAHHGALLWASNFSVGVNIFFTLNRYVAELMRNRPEYGVSVTETHHIHKLDAPSGTALTLTNDILEHSDQYQHWKLLPESAGASDIPVTAIREGEVPGTHVIEWKSAVDEIRLEHKAITRSGFASGAVLAAAWLHDKKGVFSMKDVLGLP